LLTSNAKIDAAGSDRGREPPVLAAVERRDGGRCRRFCSTIWWLCWTSPANDSSG